MMIKHVHVTQRTPLFKHVTLNSVHLMLEHPSSSDTLVQGHCSYCSRHINLLPELYIDISKRTLSLAWKQEDPMCQKRMLTKMIVELNKPYM